ncbi:Lipase [Ceratocystis lukuohia]|uniref:Lipase n=1 Tax=Ceratocystis lukuohia TaxID=2019550 RepID=A0ABR4MHS4_9PEZI
MKFSALANYAAVAAAAVIRRGDDYIELDSRDISTSLYDNLDFYVQWAQAAYCNADVANNTAVSCAYDNCPSVSANKATILTAYTGEQTEVAVIIGVDPTRKEIVVSYRGSSNIRNWIVNLSFIMSACDLVDDCYAHDGFLWAWEETGPTVMATVAAAKAANPGYTVVATGHSLGAAVATIAVGHLRAAGYPSDLYTYGSPRVGNPAFVQFITEQAGGEYRVTKLNDPVPRLPPIFSGYRHTSPEYWIDDGSSSNTAYTAADFTECDGYASTACNAGTLGLSITAHLNYLQHTGSCDSGNSKRTGLEGDAASADRVSDEDLEAQLNKYVQQDLDYASAL